MELSRSNFRIVSPAKNTFSAAEARITKTAVKFNALAACELGYPDYAQLMISQDGSVIGIAAAERNDPDAIPFMFGKTADDLNGRSKWVTITNKMLVYIIRSKMHWDEHGPVRRFRSARWPEEEDALIFDLRRPLEPRKRNLTDDPDEMLMSYRLAQQPLYPIAKIQDQMFRVPSSEAIKSAIEVQYQTV